MSNLIVYEILFLFFIIIIILVIFIRRSNDFKKNTNKRINILFDISKTFYKNKSLKEIANYSLKIFAKALPDIRFAGIVMCNENEVEYSQLYDFAKGFKEVDIPETFIKKLKETKIYFQSDRAEIELNFQNIINLDSKIKHLHVLKFYTDYGCYGAYFFGLDRENVDIYDYEFLRIFVEHFSFGIKMQYLTKKVKSYSKTIDVLENTYQKIVDNLPVGIIGIDNSKNYQILLWNEMASKIFEIEEEKKINTNFLDLFLTNKNKSILKNFIEHTIQTGKTTEIPYLKYKSRKGKKKYFLIICYQLLDPTSGFEGTILVFRDITENKNLQEKLKLSQDIKEEDMRVKIEAATKELKDANLQLKRMDDLKSEFVSIVSHELRTPLTSIRGYASLINSEKLGKLNAQQKSSMEIIEDEGVRLSNLINDILDLSKLQAGKVPLNIKKEDIVKTIKGAVRPLKIQAAQKKIEIKVQGKRNLLTYHDSEKMNRVFYNIIGNAIKFTPDNGKVNVTVRENSDFVQVSVKDTGVGIPKDQIEKIFSPFVQIELAMQRQKSGTGLGLTISQHIIELHHGFIDVESTTGEGSDFIINIPKMLGSLNQKNKKIRKK